MKTICAEMGIETPVYTKIRRPMGHGKIEAFNRLCTNDFIAEVAESSITTLDELNRVFDIWLERHYNNRYHSELGCTPLERWQKDVTRFRYAAEEKLRSAFLWREERRVDKCGMISLFGRAYRVSPQFVGRKVEIRYNPEHLELVEVWNDGSFQERVAPYVVHVHRPEKAILPEEPIAPLEKKTDYLGFVLNTYGNITDSIGDKNTEAGADQQTCAAFCALFKDNIPVSLYDEEELKRFWIRYGPIRLDEVQALLHDPSLREQPYHHISSYLNALKGARQ